MHRADYQIGTFNQLTIKTNDATSWSLTHSLTRSLIHHLEVANSKLYKRKIIIGDT